MAKLKSGTTIDGNTAWHAGNDGSGSGLDADTLDTKHASDFVAVTGDTMTNTLTISAAKTTDDPLLKLVSTATGDGDAVIELEANDTGEAGITFKNPDNTNAAGWFLGSGDAFSEQFYLYDKQNSVARLVVGHNGNVGIGTNTPSRKLHLVNGDFYTSGKSDSVGAAVGYGGNSFQIRNGSTSEDLNFDVYNRTSSSWYTPLIIKNTGNVGIGTTSPTQKLDVNGNISASGGRAVLRDNSLENHDGNANSNVAVNYFGYAGGTTQFRDFDIYNGKSSLIARFDGSTNNVGIGTTSPAYKLEVVGTSYVNRTSGGDSFLTNNTANYTVLKSNLNGARSWQIDNVNGKVQWYMDGTADEYLFNMTTDGKVGIGTTSPSQKLEVSGNIRATSSLLAGANLYLNDDNTAADTSIFFGDAASDTAHRLFFDDSDQEFRFSNSLNITGNVRSTGWMWASGNFHTNGNLYLNYDNTAADTVIYFGDAASDTAHYMLFSNAAQQYYLSDTLNMYGGVKLDHNGTGTVDSHPITFTSQFNSTDVVRELKTNSAGDLLFNGNALATEAYVTANAGGGVTSIKNFAGPYVNTNGFTAKQLPLSKTLSTGDRIGLSVIVGTTTNYGTRTQQTVWLEVGTSSHAVLFAYYDNATSTMRLYSAEVYISSGNLYIDDAVAWTDGAFGHSGSSTTAIYVMDVLEYA